jgi:hypothetical protein
VRTYYYLVESYRESGKVHQRTLAYLGEYPTVEEALARLPQDIERWTEETLPRACRERDEAKAYYDAALGRGPAPEFIVKHSQFSSPSWQQWRSYKASLRLPAARENYRQVERHVAWVQKHIAELEARLVKLQALSRPDRSAHELRSGPPFVGTTS